MMVAGVLASVPNIAAYSRIQQISAQINSVVNQRLIAKTRFEPVPVFDAGIGKNVNVVA